MDYPNKSPGWMSGHVCQDPTCTPGDCTLDRWYPRAPLTSDVKQTILISLAGAIIAGTISPMQYRLALIELERDGIQ